MTRKRILYAEDELDLKDVVVEYLIGEGYECVSVKDGLEAQECLLREKFDLLLTDFNMPRLDGAHLLFWCRKQGFHFPIVFITASPERVPIEKKALSDCCASVIHKPCNLPTIVEALEKAFNRNHEFHCHGQISHSESESTFQGQHINMN